MSRLRLNCSVIVLIPSELVELMDVSPLIWSNCDSKGVVTADVITSGLAPGYRVTTWIVGKSTCGRDAIGRRKYPRSPSMMTPAIRSEVAIGLRIKGSETFIPDPHPLSGDSRKALRVVSILPLSCHCGCSASYRLLRCLRR